MKDLLKRVAIACGVVLFISIDVLACIDVGGGAEHAPVSVGDVLLNN